MILHFAFPECPPLPIRRSRCPYQPQAPDGGGGVRAGGQALPEPGRPTGRVRSVSAGR